MSDRLQALLQGFFTDRLQHQRWASPHTIASYRDTFRLLLRFATARLHTPPAKLTLEDLRAPFIGEFLRHLELDRTNSARSRNTRLAAIRSFFRYVALNEPSHALDCQRILAMPNKRYLRQPVSFLEPREIEALLASPDAGSRIGRRDRTLLLVAIQTGLRVSELASLRCEDVELGAGAHVRCIGKGRRERCTPLRRDARSTLAAWMRERSGRPEDPLFPTTRGNHLSRDAVERIVRKYAAEANGRCPSLKGKKVTPHVLRHTAAMDLLRRGVDRTVIALWLGHESPETTGIYLHADLHMKEEALARTSPTGVGPKRYRPTDKLLAFLDGL
jgi:site-specific recombinase XerD